MDRLFSMQVFVRVAEAGSFAAVAPEFGLSTTMVANHIRELEARLGDRLIERTTRKHHLTEIGAAYLDRCRDVLAAAAIADRVGDNLRAEPQGVLRVTAPVTYGSHRLIPVIGAYMEAFPKVHVDLTLSDRVVDLADEGMDIGIRSGRIQDEDLIAYPLQISRMLAVASKTYLKRGTPRHPSDLTQHNCLGFMIWGSDHAWRFTRGDESISIPVTGSLTINNGQALAQAALSGIGIVVQADVLLENYIESGVLQRLLPDWDLPSRQVHLVRRRDLRPSAKLKSFVSFVTQALSAEAKTASPLKRPASLPAARSRHRKAESV